MASKTKTVNIEHKDGRAFAVTEYDYSNAKVDGDNTYADLGFKIVAWGDGTAYTPTSPPSKAADAKAEH